MSDEEFKENVIELLSSIHKEMREVKVRIIEMSR